MSIERKAAVLVKKPRSTRNREQGDYWALTSTAKTEDNDYRAEDTTKH